MAGYIGNLGMSGGLFGGISPQYAGGMPQAQSFGIDPYSGFMAQPQYGGGYPSMGYGGYSSMPQYGGYGGYDGGYPSYGSYGGSMFGNGFLDQFQSQINDMFGKYFGDQGSYQQNVGIDFEPNGSLEQSFQNTPMSTGYPSSNPMTPTGGNTPQPEPAPIAYNADKSRFSSAEEKQTAADALAGGGKKVQKLIKKGKVGKAQDLYFKNNPNYKSQTTAGTYTR